MTSWRCSGERAGGEIPRQRSQQLDAEGQGRLVEVEARRVVAGGERGAHDDVGGEAAPLLHAAHEGARVVARRGKGRVLEGGDVGNVFRRRSHTRDERGITGGAGSGAGHADVDAEPVHGGGGREHGTGARFHVLVDFGGGATRLELQQGAPRRDIAARAR